MSDKCLRSLSHSIGVETAVWLFCSYVLGSQDLHMHPTNCIFWEQKGILIRYEFSITSKTWRTLISSLFKFKITEGSEKTRKSVDWFNSFWLLGTCISISSEIQKDKSPATQKRWWWWYSCCRQQLQRKRVCASNQAQCISTTLFCICRMWCCLKLARHHCVSLGQVKHHILGSKLSLGWNQRCNLLLYFHLHPLCPTRTCYRGNNKSTSLFFPCV